MTDVLWGGDNTGDEVIPCNPVLQDEDSMFYEEREHEKEPFQRILRRAYAKRRDGQPLTEKEIWAISRHELGIAKRRAVGYLPTGQRGPTKRSVDRIRKICEYQLVEGLNQREIAANLGVNESTITHLLQRNSQLYHKLLQEVSDDLAGRAAVIKPAVYGRLIEKLRKSALQAPDVINDIMADAEQPGGVRLQAAKLSIESYGVGKGDGAGAVAPLSDESKKLLNDTIGVISALKDAVTPQAGRDIIVEAEVVNGEAVVLPAEGDS